MHSIFVDDGPICWLKQFVCESLKWGVWGLTGEKKLKIGKHIYGESNFQCL